MADCGKLFEHATAETDKWIEKDTVLGDGMINIEIHDGCDKDSVCSGVPLYADGVGADIGAEMSTADSDNEEEI